MIRPLRTELRRSAAPLASIAMFVAGAWTLAVHTDAWSGRWAGLAAHVRTSLVVLCGVMVAASAWQAGRERRRGMAEMLGSTPRPPWQPLLVSWFAVSLGGVVGYLIAVGIAAVFVGPVATYAGGDWPWVLAVGIEALWAASAFGFLAGRVIPLRVVAPVAGLASYLAFFAFTPDQNSGANWLSPAFFGWGNGRLLPEWTSLWQAGWLLALTATLLAAAARLRWTTAVSAMVAIAVAMGVAASPGISDLPVDAAAAKLVCTADGRICVARVNAFLLDDVVDVAGPLMNRMDGIPGAPARAIDALGHESAPRPADGDIVWLNLAFQATPSGGLVNTQWVLDDFRQMLWCATPGPLDQRRSEVANLAWSWLVDKQEFADVPLDRLKALPIEAQRSWFGEYLAAVGACDDDRLRQLGEER